MEWYEAAFDRMYPVLYRHRNIEEAAKVIDAFAEHFEGKSPILDLASGSGRYLEALRRRGHNAFGFDLSHYLLTSSVEKWGHEGVVMQGDMRQLSFADSSFGAVINMFTSFGYFSVDTDNLLVFREVHRVLRQGGTFLFDFINAEKISSDLLAESDRSAGGFDIHEQRTIEDHGKYLVKRATISDQDSGRREVIEERLRLYTRRDLEVMLKSVGFSITHVYGDYERNAFVEGVSERVIIVSEK